MSVQQHHIHWLNFSQDTAWVLHDNILANSFLRRFCKTDLRRSHQFNVDKYSARLCHDSIHVFIDLMYNVYEILHGCSMLVYSLIQCSSIFCMAVPWQHIHWFNVHQYSAWPFHDSILMDSMFINILHGCSMTAYSLMQYNQGFAWLFHSTILTDSMLTAILHGCSMPIYSMIQCLPIFFKAVTCWYAHWFNVYQYSAWPFHDSILTDAMQPRFCMAVPCQYTHWFNAYQYSSRLLHAGILTDSMFTNILHGRSMTAYPPMQCNQDYAWLFHANILNDSMLTNILQGCYMPVYSLIQCLPIFCMAVPWQHTHRCNATKIMHGCSITIYRLNCYWDFALIKAFIAFLTTWHAINPYYLFLLAHRTTGVRRVRFLKICRKRRKDGWSSLKWTRLKCRK
jgi:hypothetical protein